MSKTISLSKEFLIELLNTHCFANLAEDTDIELLDGEEKDKTQFCKTLKNTSFLDYSKLCSNCYSNYEDGCCMENCEFYNHNECPVVYVNCLLGEKDKTISDLESKLAKKDEEITRRLRLQDDGFLEERKEMEQQIADLEAKLAESEAESNARYSAWREEIRSCDELRVVLAEKDNELNNLSQMCLICNKDQENERLKQQLADKDKEIENLKDSWNVLCDYLGDCIVKFDKEDTYGIYSEVLDKVNILKRYDYKHHQAKISFAVEQIVKTKETLIKFLQDEGFYENEWYDLFDEIDNQIKQLKGGK